MIVRQCDRSSVPRPPRRRRLRCVGYFAGLPALLDGVTVGKGAMGLAIRVDGGRRVGFGRALVRAVALAGLWITFVGAIIDVIVAGTDARRQAVHDKIAGTIVVRTRS